MLKSPCYSLLVLILLLTSGCGSYDFSVNDKMVYTPRPLFTDFSAEDPALQSCLEQAVANGKISNASELRSLTCSRAGITSLTGLEVFTGLSQLRLSSNAIRDISPIAALTSLELLLLSDNQIIVVTPLLELPALIELNLANNPEMLCPSQASLITLESITLPGHCR